MSKKSSSCIQTIFEEKLAEYKKDHSPRQVESYIRGWNHKCFDTKVTVPGGPTEAKPTRKKLDAKVVKKIRREFERKTKPLTQSAICKKYGLTSGAVSGIVNYKTWRDV
jgi:hypothetical protein